MLVDQILERNRAHVAGRAARPLPSLEPLQLAVVACYDPRLDSLIHPALGLGPGEAFVFRTAGAHVRAAGATQRSLAMAVFMFGVREIAVIGHTSCRMAAFDTSQFIEMFRERGVERAAFGPEDLRTWAGAIPSPRQGVLLSIANLQAAPFLPSDLAIWGAVLDDTTSRLDLVARPGEAVSAAPAIEPAPAAEPLAEPGEPLEPEMAGSPDSGADERQEPGDDGGLVAAVEQFARALRSKSEWAYELERLRRDLTRQRNPIIKFRMLEGLAHRAGADSREVMQAFEQLKRAAVVARKDLASDELFRLFHRLAGKS